jgi:hypothetical protein
MPLKLSALLTSGVLVSTSGAVMAHHSFAMFDQENPTELTGTVREFKYTSPHSYILLEVKGQDGSTVIWNLEGQAPSLLARDGWSSQTLKPGDEIIITIHPLQSGTGWCLERDQSQIQGRTTNRRQPVEPAVQILPSCPSKEDNHALQQLDCFARGGTVHDNCERTCI